MIHTIMGSLKTCSMYCACLAVLSRDKWHHLANFHLFCIFMHPSLLNASTFIIYTSLVYLIIGHPLMCAFIIAASVAATAYRNSSQYLQFWFWVWKENSCWGWEGEPQLEQVCDRESATTTTTAAKRPKTHNSHYFCGNNIHIILVFHIVLCITQIVLGT